MRRISATDLKANLAAVLGDVERGAVVDITRHGKVIARIAPHGGSEEAERRRLAVERILEGKRTGRKTGITVKDILSARDEGRR